tara:strand:- start:44 stop:556 length:513 start_codon:yes stop_codon:yes gene_type:complete
MARSNKNSVSVSNGFIRGGGFSQPTDRSRKIVADKAFCADRNAVVKRYGNRLLILEQHVRENRRMALVHDRKAKEDRRDLLPALTSVHDPKNWQHRSDAQNLVIVIRTKEATSKENAADCRKVTLNGSLLAAKLRKALDEAKKAKTMEDLKEIRGRLQSLSNEAREGFGV